MFHIKLKRQEAGKPIIARTLNQMMELIERFSNIRVSPPLAMTETAAGPLIYLAQGDTQFFVGTTGGGYGAGSIASPSQVGPGGTGTQARIYYQESGAGFSTSTYTDTWNAYNIYGNTIAASKNAWYWQSPSTGNYYIVTADC